MAHEISSDERRIKELETQMLRLWGALDSLRHKLGQVAEDSPRQFQDDGVGRVHFRMQSVGIIPAALGATLGSGTARFLQVIGGTRYLLRPFSEGEVVATTYNDTGSPTIDNEYLICAYVDGICTALVGDCQTAAPTRAPDPPA